MPLLTYCCNSKILSSQVVRSLVAACLPDGACLAASAETRYGRYKAWAAGAAAAVIGVSGNTLVFADGPEASDNRTNGSSWFARFQTSAPPSASAAASSSSSTAPASGAAAWQQRWMYPSSGDEPLSGAIPALTDDGLTNHPLDYNPITNEHTAAMTLAKQAGIEAYEKGRYQDAEHYFTEAITEARAGFPPGDPHIPSALHYLAELYRNTRCFQKAEPLYQEALQLLRDSLGERSWLYASALCSLAALYEDKGDYQQARQLLEEALELRRQLFSAASYLYADTASLLAALLMKQHNAALEGPADADATAGKPTGGWFGRSSRTAAAVPADVAKAMSLYQAAIHIVEDAGGPVEQTPVVAWLVGLAAAQRSVGQHAAEVATLQKALWYMFIPPSNTQGGDSGGQGGGSPATAGSSKGLSAGSGSSSGGSPEADLAAPSADAMRQRLAAQASEVAERLVDAQVSAGDLPGARQTMRAAVEARMAIFGRHLVVAKSLTRLSRLLMQPPPDPEAVQLAPQLAANAVSIAEAALQGAQRSNLWAGMFRGALKAFTQPEYSSHVEAERAGNRLLAAVQLGNACLTLAAADSMNNQLPEAEAALRTAVKQLRWVLAVGQEDLKRLGATGKHPEVALLDRLAGLLVDLKLLQLDCLEALADTLRKKNAAGVVSTQQQSHSRLRAVAQLGDQPAGRRDVDDLDEVRVLLGEAELLAAELYGD